MEKTVRELLSELQTDFGLSKEGIADRFKVSARTIARWINNESNPTYAEFKMLKDIYRREKAKREKRNAEKD